MIEHLIPYVERGAATLFLNAGDHADVYERLKAKIGVIGGLRCFKNDFAGLSEYVVEIREGEAKGIALICDDDIFSAVYATNLLMPVSDLLVTKPSELAYYPIPKLFMKHIGGHEVYGAIHGREYGDGTGEYADLPGLRRALDRLLTDREILQHFCDRILELKEQGYYDGGYRCVRLAAGEATE